MQNHFFLPSRRDAGRGAGATTTPAEFMVDFTINSSPAGTWYQKIIPPFQNNNFPSCTFLSPNGRRRYINDIPFQDYFSFKIPRWFKNMTLFKYVIVLPGNQENYILRSGFSRITESPPEGT